MTTTRSSEGSPNPDLSPTRRRRFAAFCATVSALAALGLAACGSSEQSEGAPSGAMSMSMSMDVPSAGSSMDSSMPGMDQSTPTIHVADGAFEAPGPVEPGATISVMNMTSEAVTLTADAGAFDVRVAAGQRATFAAPSAPGSYAFHCAEHTAMRSVLVVG